MKFDEQNNWNLRRPFLTAGLLYAVFVVYGSLVPLDFHPIPLTQALDRFANIRFLNLGIGSRADWVANILLYVPFSFLLLASCSVQTSRKTRLIPIIIVFSMGMLAAVVVEFLQIFFAPRTVSLNDIIAEAIGIIIGIIVWCLFGHGVVGLWRRIRQGGEVGLVALFSLYLLLYLTLSFFPFDFLISQTELASKIAGPLTGWLFADVAFERPVRRLMSLVLETGLAIPLGFFFGFRRYGSRQSQWLHAFFYGGLCGVIIECLQLFTASGVSQGASIITRAVGAVCGVFCFKLLAKGASFRPQPFWCNLLGLSVLPYIIFIFKINGFFDLHWLKVTAAVDKFDWVMFQPFYYHYYTTETTAVLSVLLNIVIYSPIGFGLLAWRWCRSAPPGYPHTGIIAAALFALVVEGGKLFLVGKHPDFTNILIASVSAWAGFVFLVYLAQVFSCFDFSRFREPGS